MKLQALQSSSASLPSARSCPQFKAVVAGRTVEVRSPPEQAMDNGRVRLGTSHLIWAWLFGRRG